MRGTWKACFHASGSQVSTYLSELCSIASWRREIMFVTSTYSNNWALFFRQKWENVEVVCISPSLFHSPGNILADILRILLQMPMFKYWQYRHWKCLPIADMPILKKSADMPILPIFEYRHLEPYRQNIGQNFALTGTKLDVWSWCLKKTPTNSHIWNMLAV